MDLAAAAAYFDTIPVYDAYAGTLLFYGQLDLYDLADRDSAAGFRRTLSAAEITMPARGCAAIAGDNFVMGRQIKDAFDGEVHRVSVILHPAEHALQLGYAATFLGTGTPTSLYAGESWLKNAKEETVSSEPLPMYEFYCSASESPVPGMVVYTGGLYYRVQIVNRRTAGLAVVTAFETGAGAKQTVTYTPKGAYSVASDAYAAGTPVSTPAFVESWQAQYRYANMAATDFERGDAVITLRSSVVTSPAPGETIACTGETYRVLSRQSDGQGCWEIHGRPV